MIVAFIFRTFLIGVALPFLGEVVSGEGADPAPEMDNIVGLWLDIAGWGGAVAILASYLSVSMGWLRAGRRFQAANLVGSVAFIVNGSYYGAWPSVVTNVAWFVISAVALVRMQRAASRAAQAPEAAPVEAAAPQAPAHPVPVVTASVPLVPVPAEGWPRLPGDELTLDYKVRT